MKHYHNLENKKLMLKLEKPRLLHILSNNKIQFKNNPLNTKYKFSHNHNTSLSPLVIGNNTNNNTYNKTINNNNNNNFIKSPKKNYNNIKDISNNNIIKTTPLKYQYKKLPFEKVRGFKIKLPNPIKTKNNLNNINNYKKNILNTQQNYYPIISNHNLSTIQSNVQQKVDKQNQGSFSYLNLNFNNLNKNNIINYKNMNQKIGPIKTEANDIIHHNNNTNKKIIIFNDNKKPLHHLIETKSSSIGSKMETREESGHFKKSRSKSSFNSPQLFNNNNNINFENKNNNLIDKKFFFHKFDNINNKLKNSSKKKILKYLDKAIKQLTKIKTIILDDKDFNEYKEDIYNEEGDEDNKIQEEINNKLIKIIEKNL